MKLYLVIKLLECLLIYLKTNLNLSLYVNICEIKIVLSTRNSIHVELLYNSYFSVYTIFIIILNI